MGIGIPNKFTPYHSMEPLTFSLMAIASKIQTVPRTYI